MDPASLTRVTANGIPFACLERGRGPLVLCLHGFPDTARSFEPLLQALAAAGYRAVAPFLRGYAPSGIPADGDYRVTTLARDVLALIPALGASRAALVGHDWGAAAAYAAATLEPERVTRIVTAAVPHLRHFLRRPTARQLRRSRYMAFFQLRGIAEHRLARDGGAAVEALVREWSPGWRYAPADLAPVLALVADPARCRALLGYYRDLPAALLRRETWALLRTPVPVPARVIRGRDDGCIGREMFDGQDDCFAAGLDQVEIAGAGHFMHCEAPAAFARHVLGFLGDPR